MDGINFIIQFFEAKIKAAQEKQAPAVELSIGNPSAYPSILEHFKSKQEYTIIEMGDGQKFTLFFKKEQEQ